MDLSAMKQNQFSAVLKTLEDKVIEYGSACVSEEDQSIKFKSEFVPICEMGTPLKIVRMENQVETQSFVGTVYVSSQRLLRLVSLTDEVLPGASSAFIYDVDIQGMATAILEPIEEPQKRFSLRRKRPQHSSSKPTLQVFPVSIHAISLSQIKFTCNKIMPKGQRVTLSIRYPVDLKDLMLEVDLPIALSDTGTCSYHCKILKLEGSNALHLEPYVDKLSLMKNKLFPPANATPAEGADS